MKIKTFNILAVMTVLLWCATGRAQLNQIGSQIIYSNAFNPSSPTAGVSIEYTAPTYITPTNLMGASSSATWALSATNNDPVHNPNAVSIYQGGTIGTNVGTALLPLTVQTNAVYIEYVSLTVPASMPTWVGPGFTTAVSNPTENQTNLGFARFNDNPPNGYDWMTLQAGAKPAWYAGSKTTLGQTLPTVFSGSTTHYIEMVLDTLLNTNLPAITNYTHHGETNDWVMACFVDGNREGTTNVYYSLATPNGPPPLALNDCGIGQNTWVNDNTAGVQWNYFTLSTPVAPLFFQQPAATNTVNQNANFTNTVWALADTNGGALAYQWYTNGIPLSNGGNISGATSASLIINSVIPGDAGTDYVVVVTNTYGAVTSSPASLYVFGPPVFTEAFPLTYTNLGSTNLMFLYGGSGAYSGSSPSFVVGASGAQPMSYYWFTNGVPVGGATSTNLAFTNLSMIGPTTISCVASNFDETTTNTWAVTYLPSPTTPFQAAVMAAQPFDYWRLNEPDNEGGNGPNDGNIADDYESGNNGIYTNVILGVPSGYSPTTDPSETAAAFGSFDSLSASCDANSIGGANLDFSGSSNAEYTVALWASSDGITSGFNEPGNGGLFCKGYFSGEEACLDTDPHTFNVRLTLRNAAGTQFNCVSSENLGTDNNWHFIVGECDESNGLISIYIDGKLEGQSNILSGSGIINSATTPIMIGARSSDALPADAGNQQFEGTINDVAVYGYAMSPGQIAAQYEAAGYSITPYVEILTAPPTNVVYLVNSTVTLPATVFGSPPYGYYWTNLTVGGIIASNSTTSSEPLDATLTLPNISSSLSGDQLELVVTNASASATALVNLSAAPAPVTLSYTNAILYSNSFNGGTYSVNGTALSAANMLVGGTSTTWTATWTNASGQIITVSGNGNVATNQGEVLVPFTPEQGYIYTMSGTLAEPSSMADYIHMGFCQSDAQTSNGAVVRFNDSPINGYDWLALENASITFYKGAGANNSIGADSSVPAAPTTNTMQIILNCLTNNEWVASASVNGVGIGTNYYNGSLPPIAYAGIGQQVNPGSEQWQSWAITQFAPGGVPPYLLVTPPTNSILLTNATIALPATAFGSAIMGYEWINNASVIASGVTNIPNPSVPNNAAPIAASLSIPSTSLSAGLLQLVVTNAYGTNTTSITLVSPINPNPTNIVATVTNSILYLTWPTDHIGWQLQAQTNNVGVGIGANWVNFNPSTGLNQVAIPVNVNNGTVFYRLTY